MGRRRLTIIRPPTGGGGAPVLNVDVLINDAPSYAAAQALSGHILGAIIVSAGCPAVVELPGVLSFGSLVASGNDIVTLRLPNAIAGSVNATSCAGLVTLDLRALVRTIGSVIVSTCAALTTLDLGALAFTGGQLRVATCGALTTLSLPSLATVQTNCEVNNCTALTTLDLSALTTTGGSCIVTTCADLTTLNLSSLVTTGASLQVSALAALTTLSLPSLTTVGTLGSGTRQFNVFDCPKLAALEAPMLHTVNDSVRVSGNTLQADLDLTALTKVGAANASTFRVNLNPALCDSIVAARVAALTAAGWAGLATTNGNKGGC